jgi:hypothetical protein
MSEAPPSLAYCKSALLLSATAELRPNTAYLDATDAPRGRREGLATRKAPKRDGSHGSTLPVLATSTLLKTGGRHEKGTDVVGAPLRTVRRAGCCHVPRQLIAAEEHAVA